MNAATWMLPLISANRIAMSETESVTLNEKTKVPLGWLVAVACAVLGIVGFGAAAIFWAATLNAKVDMLINARSVFEQSSTKHDSDILAIQNKMSIWETYSGPWSKEQTSIERRVSDLERKMVPAKP